MRYKIPMLVWFSMQHEKGVSVKSYEWSSSKVRGIRLCILEISSREYFLSIFLFFVCRGRYAKLWGILFEPSIRFFGAEEKNVFWQTF